MRSIDSHFYKTPRWKKTRVLYALSKYGLCERCNRPIYMTGVNDYIPKEKRLKGIVHHKEHLNEMNYTNEEIAYAFDNLELLCVDCHNKIHFKSEITRDGYSFDEEGNLIKG